MKKNIKKDFGIVTDAPNVTAIARKLLCGEVDGVSGFLEIIDGCYLNAHSGIEKNLYIAPTIKNVVEKIIKFSQLFCNAHHASNILNSLKKVQDSSPETTKP